MNKLPTDIQNKIYSFYCYRDTYNDDVSIKNKFKFDDVLNDIIDVQDICAILNLHFGVVDTTLEIVLKNTKLKKYYCKLIFFELLSRDGVSFIVLKTFLTMRKILGLKFIHLNKFLEKNDFNNLFN